MLLAFLKYAYWGNAEITPNEAERLLSPSAWEFADLLFNTKSGELWAGFGYILRGVRNLLLWLLWGFVGFVKRATAEKDPARFSHYQVPEYWHLKAKTETITVEGFEVRGGGFPIAFGKNGLEYSEPETKSDVRAKAEKVKLTDVEREKMLANDPPLRNMALAEKIKNYLFEGKSDYEAAMLAGCSESYVKKHRLCFDLAQTPSPL